MAKQNQSEDVKLLSNQVNERLRQAIESDTVLAGNLQGFKGQGQWYIPRGRDRDRRQHGYPGGEEGGERARKNRRSTAVPGPVC